MPEKKIKVMVVDDLRSAREMIRINLESDPVFEVVGYASSGKEAIKNAIKLKPDMITMDVNLPDTNGIEVVEKIMAVRPVPMVMITASISGKPEYLFRAIEAGAIDVLEKTELYTFKSNIKVAREFTKKMRNFYNVKVLPHPVRGVKKEKKIHKPSFISDTPQKLRKVVAIASSTGGPNALRCILSKIPDNVPAAFLIVQHMSRGFIKGLAGSLNDESSLEIRIAKAGDRISPGVAFIAPDDRNMLVNNEGTIRLNRSPPVNGHRPAAALLLPSVAGVFGKKTIGVILTGMGDDGAEGMKVIKNSGGKTIAQNEESCVVFGMPKVAISLGSIDRVLHVSDIAEEIIKML